MAQKASSGSYDYGPERVSWLGNLVTNWMGDDGFMKLLRRKCGATISWRCDVVSGEVVNKEIKDGQRWSTSKSGENQRDDALLSEQQRSSCKRN